MGGRGKGEGGPQNPKTPKPQNPNSLKFYYNFQSQIIFFKVKISHFV
jgi:hypothetical protein